MMKEDATRHIKHQKETWWDIVKKDIKTADLSQEDAQVRNKRKVKQVTD